MFVALTLAIKREAPKMSHTQFLRSPVCSNTNMVRKTKRRSNNPPMHIDIHGTVCTCVVPCGKTEVIIGKSPMCRYR